MIVNKQYVDIDISVLPKIHDLHNTIDTFCISNIFQTKEHNMLYFKEQKSQLVLKSSSNFFVKSEITLDFKECMCYNIDRLDRPT